MIRFDRGFVASAGFGTFMGVGGYRFTGALLVSVVSGLAGVWMGRVGLVEGGRVRTVEQFLANACVSMTAWWTTSRAFPPPVRALPAGRARVSRFKPRTERRP